MYSRFSLNRVITSFSNPVRRIRVNFCGQDARVADELERRVVTEGGDKWVPSSREDARRTPAAAQGFISARKRCIENAASLSLEADSRHLGEIVFDLEHRLLELRLRPTERILG